MGLGDEIMVTGEARRVQMRDPRPVAVAGRDGRARWHPLWHGNPRIAAPREVAAGRAVQWIVNGPGRRPYIDDQAMARGPRAPWRFTAWRATPGELPCVPRRPPAGYVVVEPHLKPGASPNKQWGWANWQALVGLMPRVDWVQLGPPGMRVLEGAVHIPTPSFIEAGSALSGAAAAVLPDGGLHHAAAALGVPAVVIFGGFTSPANLGYDGHVNLFDPADGQSPCGERVPCAHCRRVLAAIRPETVAAHLERILNDGVARARAG